MHLFNRLFHRPSRKKADDELPDFRRWAQEHPEYFTDAYDQFLTGLIIKAQQEGNHEQQVQLEQMRSMLRHFREVGIDAAVQEVKAEGGIYLSQSTQSIALEKLTEFIAAPTMAESRRILEEHSELLTDAIDLHLGEIITKMQVEGNQGMQQTLELNRALLRRCRERGIDAAFQELD